MNRFKIIHCNLYDVDCGHTHKNIFLIIFPSYTTILAHKTNNLAKCGNSLCCLIVYKFALLWDIKNNVHTSLLVPHIHKHIKNILKSLAHNQRLCNNKFCYTFILFWKNKYPSTKDCFSQTIFGYSRSLCYQLMF